MSLHLVRTGPEQLSAFVLFWLRSPRDFAACQDTSVGIQCDLRDEVNSEDVTEIFAVQKGSRIQRHGTKELHAFIRKDCSREPNRDSRPPGSTFAINSIDL